MATTEEKATSLLLRRLLRQPTPCRIGAFSTADPSDDRIHRTGASVLIHPVDSLPQPSTNPTSSKGLAVMLRVQSHHPLDPLTTAEISVAVATVRAAGATPEGDTTGAKLFSSTVVPDVQPPMDAVEYAECEAVIKDFPPFRKAMKRRY
ncbi:primary-amine oxidase [Sarracenia purpurea var. burkii]